MPAETSAEFEKADLTRILQMMQRYPGSLQAAAAGAVAALGEGWQLLPAGMDLKRYEPVVGKPTQRVDLPDQSLAIVHLERPDFPPVSEKNPWSAMKPDRRNQKAAELQALRKEFEIKRNDLLSSKQWEEEDLEDIIEGCKTLCEEQGCPDLYFRAAVGALKVEHSGNELISPATWQSLRKDGDEKDGPAPRTTGLGFRTEGHQFVVDYIPYRTALLKAKIQVGDIAVGWKTPEEKQFHGIQPGFDQSPIIDIKFLRPSTLSFYTASLSTYTPDSRPLIMEMHTLEEKKLLFVRIQTFLYPDTPVSDLLKTSYEKIAPSESPAGIVLDLRNNSGGDLREVIESLDLFLDEQEIATLNRPDDPSESYRTFRTRSQTLFPNVPLVILVDSRSYSGTELFALALEEKRNALILGQPTPGFGAVHQIQMFPTVSGRYLIKRLAGFLSTAEGRTLEKNPIQPEYLIQRQGRTVSLIKNPNYSGRNSLDSETANRVSARFESNPIGPASLPESADEDLEKLLALRILSVVVR